MVTGVTANDDGNARASLPNVSMAAFSAMMPSAIVASSQAMDRARRNGRTATRSTMTPSSASAASVTSKAAQNGHPARHVPQRRGGRQKPVLVPGEDQGGGTRGRPARAAHRREETMGGAVSGGTATAPAGEVDAPRQSRNIRAGKRQRAVRAG